jgi:hypothetical protein
MVQISFRVDLDALEASLFRLPPPSLPYRLIIHSALASDVFTNYPDKDTKFSRSHFRKIPLIDHFYTISIHVSGVFELYAVSNNVTMPVKRY